MKRSENKFNGGGHQVLTKLTYSLAGGGSTMTAVGGAGEIDADS